MSSNNIKHNMENKSQIQVLYEAVKETIASWFERKIVDYYRDPENLKWYKKEVRWVEMSEEESKEYENTFIQHSDTIKKFENGFTLHGNRAWPQRKLLLKQPLEVIKSYKFI